MTTPSVPFPPTVPNLIRHAAAQFASRDYVVTPDQRLTFGSAEMQSRLLAKRLLKAGVSKGTRVGLLFPQGPDFVTALLAITRIGGLAIPLSTFLRPAELRRAVRHGDVDTLMAPRVLLGRTFKNSSKTPGPNSETATIDISFFLTLPSFAAFGSSTAVIALGRPGHRHSRASTMTRAWEKAFSKRSSRRSGRLISWS